MEPVESDVPVEPVKRGSFVWASRMLTVSRAACSATTAGPRYHHQKQSTKKEKNQNLRVWIWSNIRRIGRCIFSDEGDEKDVKDENVQISVVIKARDKIEIIPERHGK